MSKNIFNSIMVKKVGRNAFDLSHDVKFSGKMGELIPVLATEVVPGDKFNIGADILVRYAPLIAPVMHRFDVSIHYFFVPNRLVWPTFPEWISGQATEVAPYITVDDDDVTDYGRFLDYMGVPLQTGMPSLTINALPFAAYQMVYNEYYRDQNLINEVPFELASGDNSTNKAALLNLRKRAWQHDYFTSALPFAQKGPDATIPLGKVELNPDWADPGNSKPIWQDSAGDEAVSADLRTDGSGVTIAGTSGPQVAYNPGDSLQVGSTTINDLRRAFKLQEWLEKMARGGSRYIEVILSHFGVKSSDKRLQRPEYITGVRQPVVVSEVLNTSGQVLPDGDAGDPLPQGNMAGHAVSVGFGKSGSYYAEEHGFIIGIMSVMPKPAYMQGLHRQYSKLDVFDYYWPSFANLGEQEVKNKEIYCFGGQLEETFGYVPRYSEYKYIPSRVAGDFRGNLDYWHLARKFADPPLLNQAFIECDPADLTRIFAVEDNGVDNLYCQVVHKISAYRPMPVYGTPML